MVEKAERYDAVVIGGGHNGLVTAAYLARAGKTRRYRNVVEVTGPLATL